VKRPAREHSSPQSEPHFDYDERYYRHCVPGIPYTETAHEGHWPKFFRSVAELIMREIVPTSVLDAGCAKGFLVGALKDLGVRAYGVDISQHAIASVRPDLAPVCKVGSLTAAESYAFEPRYDLITCFEVVEHMPENEALAAIAQMCAHTDMVLFSSTASDFTEPSHVNVWPRLYWIRAFQRQDFLPVFSCGIRQIVAHGLLFCRRSRFPEDRELGFLDSAFRGADLFRDELVQQQKEALAQARRALDEKEQEIRKLTQQLLARTSDVRELEAARERSQRDYSDLLQQACALSSTLARNVPHRRRKAPALSELAPALAPLRDDALLLGVAAPGERLEWSPNLQDRPARRYALGTEMRALKGNVLRRGRRGAPRARPGGAAPLRPVRVSDGACSRRPCDLAR
jgi:SAM-dependent methyltransferase